MTVSYSCIDILSGRAPQDAPVTLRGWVRTRRDSKAGISFVHVSDGSCFHPVQAVVPSTLAQLRRRGAASHRRLRGRGDRHARAVAGQGPAVRDAGHRDAGRRLGRRPGHLPDPAEARTRSSSCARSRTCGRAPTCRRDDARAAHARQGDPPLLPRAAASSGSTRRSSPRRDCEGAGELFRVTHARPRQPAAHAARARWTSRRTSSAASRSSPCRAS